MPFSNDLLNAIENIATQSVNIGVINRHAKNISEKYRANDNDGKRIVTQTDEAKAYALARMPATYESVKNVLNKVFEKNNFVVNSVLDVGCGTGAATWAMYDNYNFEKYMCLEREPEMINIGKMLMKDSDLLKSVTWKSFDVINDDITEQYDLVITSYVINELPKNEIEDVVAKLWNSTKKVLVIIEPGTPRGFSNILKIRKQLLDVGAHLIAPCPHENECLLKADDWCQFSCRVQRSKLHKQLKDGSSPFEDEKYSYIAFSKDEVIKSKNRILRHPIINKGYSEYRICTENEIKNIKLSKKDGIAYKDAKKKSAGDCLDI